MLFLGLIARKVMGGDNKHKHPRDAAYLAPVGLPVTAIPCNCRGGRYCPQCSQHSNSQQHMATIPVMATAPIVLHHNSRREWKYERRAMREARRAARRGYGYSYGYPAAATAVPVAASPMGNVYARGYHYHDDDYRAADSLSMARPEQRPADYWEDNNFGVPASSSKGQRRHEIRKDRQSSADEEYSDEEQGEELPPKYERGDWEPRTNLSDASTQSMRRY
ncbi:hypothetical protein VMCG_03611 [Cytospora schulzeri]|uniref:Uncharacterized protein n=1 Tax=Cytospora schulzeri TaxID=448051 RepID=A0A423WWB0_9PEZI|nr:hypothetical protein VMCG_03611 [Valsa malicola]